VIASSTVSIDLHALENVGAGHKDCHYGKSQDGSAGDENTAQNHRLLRKGRIAPGAHVHTHNVVMKEFGRDYQFCADAKTVDYYAPEKKRAIFKGFARPDGRVGTRNYVCGDFRVVNCSASVFRIMYGIGFRTGGIQNAIFPNVDGGNRFHRIRVVCAISIRVNRRRFFSAFLAGIAQHPNISGYVMIGLGMRNESN